MKLKALIFGVMTAICALSVALPAVAANNTKSTAGTKKPSASSKKAKKTAAKPRAKKATRTSNRSSDATCKTIRVKTAKGVRTRRDCTPARDMKSPISANALSNSNDADETQGRIRAVPERAYAVDGETFFHQGRKFRIEGVAPDKVAIGSDLAKQRLQLLLDGGPLSLEQVSVDESGVAQAVVRVNGQNLADAMNGI